MKLLGSVRSHKKISEKIMKLLFVLSAAVLIISMLCAFLPIHNEAGLYDKVLRLHVLANSDSEEDQALKLKVRDAVIATVTPLVSGLSSLDEVKTTMENSLELVRSAALDVITAEGKSYDVAVTLDREDYPTKKYESVCFPAGEYLSLRVMIGAAEGQNWWCVLFPPLCLSAAGTKDRKKTEDAFVSAGLTEDQYKTVTETDNVKYRARFRFLEIFHEIFGK